MDELLVAIIKLIIRGIASLTEHEAADKLVTSVHRKPTKPAMQVKPAPAPPRRSAVAAKGKLGSARSSPARPVVVATERGRSIVDRPLSEPAARATSLSARTSPATQIAEALRSQKNLATALAMTELLMKPVALRRVESN
jgi:hypothetical protein